MEFYLKKEVFKKIAVKHLAFQLCIALILIMILYGALGGYNDIWYLILPAVIVYEVVKQTMDFIKLRKEWCSYRILLNAEGIQKTQHKKADISIMKEDITRIVEIPGSGMSIQTQNAGNYLFIPVTLENYELCRNELLKWRTIEETPVTPPSAQNEAKQFFMASYSRNGYIKGFIKGALIFLAGFILLVVFMFFIILYLSK
jgi:hypothetical protein